MTGALCPAFREAAAATATAHAYGRGRLVGIVPWETTFTDAALLSIAVRLPGRVVAQRFGAAREATTGADWQWWFKDDTGYAGMRVQAKLSAATQTLGPLDFARWRRRRRTSGRPDGWSAPPVPTA